MLCRLWKDGQHESIVCNEDLESWESMGTTLMPNPSRLFWNRDIHRHKVSLSYCNLKIIPEEGLFFPEALVQQPVQYCWQHWTMWAAQHCSILISTTRDFLPCSKIHHEELHVTCIIWTRLLQTTERQEPLCVEESGCESQSVLTFACIRFFIEIFLAEIGLPICRKIPANYNKSFTRVTKILDRNWTTIYAYIPWLVFLPIHEGRNQRGTRGGGRGFLNFVSSEL